MDKQIYRRWSIKYRKLAKIGENFLKISVSVSKILVRLYFKLC